MVRILHLVAKLSIILPFIFPRLGLAEEVSSNWINTDHTSVRLFVTNLEPEIKSKKLLVGLHFKLKDGWKILNIQKFDGVDYQGDISDLSQFEDNSIDEIYASHVVEHVPKKK